MITSSSYAICVSPVSFQKKISGDWLLLCWQDTKGHQFDHKLYYFTLLIANVPLTYNQDSIFIVTIYGKSVYVLYHTSTSL